MLVTSSCDTIHCDSNQTVEHRRTLQSLNDHLSSDATRYVEMTYEQPGSWKLFDAQLMHRSGVSYADTIKIAIFFEEVDGEGKAVKKKNTKGKATKEASSSAAKKKEEKAEADPEPEEEAEAAEEEEEWRWLWPRWRRSLTSFGNWG